MGGSESEMFNRLEEIVMAKEPRTPALKCAITITLDQEELGDAVRFSFYVA